MRSAEVSLREPGQVHVYTGDGKGKTTAALGLALRAAGAGLRVLLVQFLKGSATSELAALKLLGDRITVKRYGSTHFVRGAGSAADRAAARRGLAAAARAMAGGRYGLVVLDEACVAVHFGLFSVGDLLAALRSRAAGVEVVVTGRRAPQKLIDAADLVTEMRELKHYYRRGLTARRGIES